MSNQRIYVVYGGDTIDDAKEIAKFYRKKDANDFVDLHDTEYDCMVIISKPRPIKIKYNCLGGKECY